MSRISLKETYDNRSVIAQIAKVTDTAEDAAETVEQKATEINDALTDVNAAVQAAEGAVTTANAASAAAQQSAQTVAGYENRLATVEDDLNAVTLRITTAEGQIVTIQGRVTALETADGQNVKINRINDYAVGLTGNQVVYGNKIHVSTVSIRTPFRRDENPGSTVISPSYLFVDDQGNNIGGVSTSKEANGNTRMYITLVNKIDGVAKTGSLRFSVTADGTTSLQLIDTSNNYHTIASF